MTSLDKSLSILWEYAATDTSCLLDNSVAKSYTTLETPLLFKNHSVDKIIFTFYHTTDFKPKIDACSSHYSMQTFKIINIIILSHLKLFIKKNNKARVSLCNFFKSHDDMDNDTSQLHMVACKFKLDEKCCKRSIKIDNSNKIYKYAKKKRIME